MPLPEDTDEALRYVRMVASRAMATAYTEEPRGPVHLNFPFREPLVPAPYEFRVAHATPEARFTEAYDPQAPGNVDYLALKLEIYERGLIVCGPNSGIYAASELTQLARNLGFPVLADPLSDLRCGPHYDDVILGAYDSFLHSPSLAETLEPELILRFGDPPTSKPLATYMARYRHARQIAVAPPGRWPDPDLTADEIIHCEPTQLCIQLAGLIHPVVREDGWLASWQQAESVTRDVMRDALAASDAPTEPSAILDLATVLPDGYTVFAGNSMPVRDLDTFFPAGERQAYFLANRGASGIDGVLSSALGASAVSGGRLVLVIGDLSFYHDMNGLLAVSRHGLSATIVLLNNDGGGIFSFLPQNDDQEHFETLFGTPHGLDFAPVADLYGLDYSLVRTRDEYRAALERSFDARGVQVIEVRTDRVANLKLHRDIWQAVDAAVSGASPT
jgi:2-succinyl-5-enolpyruvyl-6-hydroxy-3-cyclohexene-1-carboxylate synthase